MININTVIFIIIAIIVFGSLIFVHELGHFITAKLCHVRVNEFALGMGPAFFKVKRGETTFSLRIFPIGGFCAMEGEDTESSDNRSFNKRPIWQRVIVLVAGAFMNILVGFIIILCMTAAQPKIASTRIAEFSATATSNALDGLKVGDEILKINGASVHIATDITLSLLEGSGSKADFMVIRDGKKIELKQVSFPMIDNGNGGKLMERDFYVYAKPKTVINILRDAFYWTIAMVKLVWVTLIQLISGRYGVKDLAGPVGTTVAIGQAATQGMSSLFYMVAMIAVNLGVVNLLPIPALDGGRLLFVFLEAIRRKPMKPQYEGYVHLAGFALFILLTLVVTFNDIIRIFK